MSSALINSEGLVTTKAIVVSALKYSEADLIVECFTENYGAKTYLLKNILKSKRGKLRTSMFQVLTLLEIVAEHRNNRNLQYVREAKIVYPYNGLHHNVLKTSLALFLSEILRNSIQVEQADKSLYAFLEASFIWLDKATNFANFHLLFLLKLSRFFGFNPDNSLANFPYFNLLEGTFQKEKSDKYCLEHSDSILLKSLLNSDFEALFSLKLNRSERNHFLELLLLYYELHLSGFRQPKSLAVLQQLFE